MNHLYNVATLILKERPLVATQTNNQQKTDPATIGGGSSGVGGLSDSGVFSGGQSRKLTHWRNRTA